MSRGVRVPSYATAVQPSNECSEKLARPTDVDDALFEAVLSHVPQLPGSLLLVERVPLAKQHHHHRLNSKLLLSNCKLLLTHTRCKDRERFRGFRGHQRKNSGFLTKLETVRHRRSKEASILWSHHEETRELRGERDNARNNARCTKARKATHGLDGQHQDVDRTLRGESIRMTEDRDKWRKYVHSVANPRIEDG